MSSLEGPTFKKKKHMPCIINVHYHNLFQALEREDVTFIQNSYPDENHSLGHVKKFLYHNFDTYWTKCFGLQSVIKTQNTLLFIFTWISGCRPRMKLNSFSTHPLQPTYLPVHFFARKFLQYWNILMLKIVCTECIRKLVNFGTGMVETFGFIMVS